MRRLRFFGPSVGLLVLAGSAFAADFVAAPLSGGEEVPANSSRARGSAVFDLSADGLSLTYQLNVANIENVTASHIHASAAPGTNAGVVCFLAGPFPPGGGRTDGVLATGTITAANLVGSLAGHPLADLLSAMQAGLAYVNVHTNDGVAPTNTGPGDFPGGEIRAQIRPSE